MEPTPSQACTNTKAAFLERANVPNTTTLPPPRFPSIILSTLLQLITARGDSSQLTTTTHPPQASCVGQIDSRVDRTGWIGGMVEGCGISIVYWPTCLARIKPPPPLFSETLAEPFSSLVVEVDDGVLYPHKMAILGKSSLAKRRNFLRKRGKNLEIWIKF